LMYLLWSRQIRYSSFEKKRLGDVFFFFGTENLEGCWKYGGYTLGEDFSGEYEQILSNFKIRSSNAPVE